MDMQHIPRDGFYVDLLLEVDVGIAELSEGGQKKQKVDAMAE